MIHTDKSAELKGNFAYFGGSFNPIHRGHVAIVEQLCRCDIFERVLVVPTGQNPLKERALLPPQLRLELTQIALAHTPATVLEHEIFAEKPCYTLDSLLGLRNVYGPVRFGIILGSDALFSVPQWKAPQRVLELADIYRIKRRGEAAVDPSGNLEGLGGIAYQELEFDIPAASSTYIRAHLHQPERIAAYLPERVLQRLLQRHKRGDAAARP